MFRVWGNSGWLPRKEITDHEVTISNHSFNEWLLQRHCTKILALAQARAKICGC